MKTNTAEVLEAAQESGSKLAEIPPASVSRHPLERPMLEVAQVMAPWQLRALLRASLGDLHVGLCLHRVADGVAGDWLTVPTAELDALIELLRSSRPGGERPWLTVGFDDGYDDAAQYVRTRAPRYPDVEWLLFVCPEKTEKRLPFHWDKTADGAPLATVDTLRAVAKLPNVALGNHTNSHRRQTLLSQEDAAREYASSSADFERLFGPQRHFAFPFGTPDREFELRHVTALRELEPQRIIWSTESRPFEASERGPGAVLPRFPIDGEWSHRQTALWICASALRYRMLGPRCRY